MLALRRGGFQHAQKTLHVPEWEVSTLSLRWQRTCSRQIVASAGSMRRGRLRRCSGTGRLAPLDAGTGIC